MCLDILTRIFGYIKHQRFFFLAAFTYSFAVHRFHIKRHSQRPCKLCYIVNVWNLFLKKRKTYKQTKKKQKLVIMNKSDKSSHKSIDFTQTTHVRKN